MVGCRPAGWPTPQPQANARPPQPQGRSGRSAPMAAALVAVHLLPARRTGESLPPRNLARTRGARIGVHTQTQADTSRAHGTNEQAALQGAQHHHTAFYRLNRYQKTLCSHLRSAPGGPHGYIAKDRPKALFRKVPMGTPCAPLSTTYSVHLLCRTIGRRCKHSFSGMPLAATSPGMAGCRQAGRCARSPAACKPLSCLSLPQTK